MTLHTFSIDVCPDQGPCLNDWDATFSCTHERADRAAGFPGGWTCEFLWAQLGGLTVTRSMLELITSRGDVEAIEALFTEQMTADSWAEIA